MTRPRKGCSFTVGLHVTRNSGICGFPSFHGLSGPSETHERLGGPAPTHPFAVSMPVMCIPWHVAHVRLVGLPSPTELRCIESLIQNVRNMNTSCPRAIVLGGPPLRFLFPVFLMRHVAPLAAEWENIASGVVAEHPGTPRRKIAWSERRRTIGFDQATGRGS